MCDRAATAAASQEMMVGTQVRHTHTHQVNNPQEHFTLTLTRTRWVGEKVAHRRAWERQP